MKLLKFIFRRALSTKLVFLLSGFLLLACQQKPTQTTVQLPILNQASTVDTKEYINALLKEDPVILDARSVFDYNLSHVPSAVHIRWEDFSQTETHQRGLLQNDLTALARRLALLGVAPERKVLVLGYGLEGQGEEGRIAWMLQYLGVPQVFTLQYRELRSLHVQEAPQTENKPFWSPQIDETASLDLASFKNEILRPACKAVILDVRSAELFKQKNFSQISANHCRVLNVPWKSFYTSQGRVAPGVYQQMLQNKVTTDTPILVVGEGGLESAAVTHALRFSGFKNSTLFVGGYEQWNASK